MSVISTAATIVKVKREYACEPCSYTTDVRGALTQHLKTETHITNAYNKLMNDNAMKQFKNAIKTMELKVSEAEEMRNEAVEMIETLQSKMDASASELIKIKNELIKVKSENESLKKEAECDDKSEATSVATPYNPATINNYGPEHEKNRHMFENLFGIKPIRYVPQGTPLYGEFQMLRSSFQNAYTTWKIYPLHLTSSNINSRITIGVPTLALQKDSVVPFVYYIKYHVYMKPGSASADALCGWNGKSEVLMIKY
jgi:hypothetical protein